MSTPHEVTAGLGVYSLVVEWNVYLILVIGCLKDAVIQVPLTIIVCAKLQKSTLLVDCLYTFMYSWSIVCRKERKYMARELTRMTVSLPSELVKRVDTYAENMGIKRTSATAVLLTMALDSQKAMTDLGELLKVIQHEQDKQHEVTVEK